MRHRIRANFKPPESIYSEEELEVMQFQSTYEVEEPGLKIVKNAFVTSYGVVMKSGLLIPGSAINLWGDRDSTLYYTTWKRTLEQYLVSRWGKSLTRQQLPNDQKFLLVHSKWFNYSFWITDYVHRLIRAEQNGYFSNAKLIVPAFFLQHPYVMDTLQTFNIAHEVVPNGSYLKVPCLILPETRRWRDSYYPPHIKEVRTRLLHEASKRDSRPNVGKRIFLTRKKRGVRNIINEDEVASHLEEIGFTRVNFEDYSIWQQILLMAEAEILVGLHGAGLANAMFMPQQALIIELLENDFFHYHHTFPYWKLASSVGVDYLPLTCNSPSTGSIAIPPGRDHRFRMELVNRDVMVDIDKLDRLIGTTIS